MSTATALFRQTFAFFLLKPFRWLRFYTATHHVLGPKRHELDPHDVIVLALMKNAALTLRDFIEHHTRLGVRHFVLIDNGSDDATLAIAREYDYVTVLQNRLPFGTYKNMSRTHLARKYARDHWALILDIDELFDYPHSDRVQISDFVRYLEEQGYTAVYATLLDMFSDQPISTPSNKLGRTLLEAYPYFDTSNVDAEPYETVRSCRTNTTSRPDLRIRYGGIRKTLFGSRVLLTKHPLVRYAKPLELLPAHYVRNAHVADVTSILYHFKLTHEFHEVTKRALQQGDYSRGSQEYKEYYKVLRNQQDLISLQPTSKKLSSIADLMNEQFITTSEAYESWVARNSR